MGGTRLTITCYFCDADHSTMNCPYQEKARQFVKQLKDKERERRHCKRTSEKPRRKDPNNHGLAGVVSDMDDPDSGSGGASTSDPTARATQRSLP